jgi:hypothetical protein
VPSYPPRRSSTSACKPLAVQVVAEGLCELLGRGGGATWAGAPPGWQQGYSLEDVRAYHERWVSEHGASSLAHRLVAARGLLDLSHASPSPPATHPTSGSAASGSAQCNGGLPSAVGRARELVIGAAAATRGLTGGGTARPAAPGPHDQCVEAEELLRSWNVGDDAVAAWRSACAAAYPCSRHFGGSKCVELSTLALPAPASKSEAGGAGLTVEPYAFDGMAEAFGRLSFV